MLRNPIDRYSVGGRPGLLPNADGSIAIYIRSTAPAGHESNWLPAPAGNFKLMLRSKHVVARRGGGYKHVLQEITEQYREYKVNKDDEARLPTRPVIRRHGVQHKPVSERYPSPHRSEQNINGGQIGDSVTSAAPPAVFWPGAAAERAERTGQEER